jgi:hypothetical protein
MDALTEVCNEEIRLCDARLLQSATVLAADPLASSSSSARPATPMPLASPLVPAARDESVGLHCDNCDRDGHVEAFYYRKKKDQKAHARRSSQGTGDTSSRGSVRSHAGSETQRFLCCFIALRFLRRQELLVL